MSKQGIPYELFTSNHSKLRSYFINKTIVLIVMMITTTKNRFNTYCIALHDEIIYMKNVYLEDPETCISSILDAMMGL
jgi:hypothetical protein